MSDRKPFLSPEANRIAGDLSHRRGRDLWRSLDELAGSESFRRYLQAEFPGSAEEIAFDRRGFFKLMAASLALGGMGGCSQPPEEIVPYVEQPEGMVPGKPLFFATAMPMDGFGKGVLVESNMGRPTKVEGNPAHPASLGATDVFGQASVLQLWDPDRSQTPMLLGEVTLWSEFVAEITRSAPRLRRDGGKGLRILTPHTTSPTLNEQLGNLLESLPNARWHRFQPVDDVTNAEEASRRVFGEPLTTHFHFDRADVVLSLDGDFLGAGPARLRYARDLARRKAVDDNAPDPSRLYVIESSPTITGAFADHRMPARASRVEDFARRVATHLNVDVLPGRALEGPLESFAAAVAEDLARHRGRAIVVAGDRQPPAVHVVALALNQSLGQAGVTLTHTQPATSSGAPSLEALRDDMASGAVDTLLISGVNPAVTAPADLEFVAQLENVELTIHHGLYRDETARLCRWHIPDLHYLESWSDIRAYDGTATILQPLVAPLYEGRSIHELVALISGQSGRSAHDIVRRHWQDAHSGGNFEAFWKGTLHDGIVPGTALPSRQASFDAQAAGAEPVTAHDGQDALEVVFAPDPCIWDGQFANNGWLQELPKPVTALTWDNAALLSPGTAEARGLVNEDVVRLRYRGREVEAPVWIVPGHADGSVTLHFGYGQLDSGRVSAGRGFDAFALRTSAAPWFDSGLELRLTDRRYPLSTTQNHHAMEGRDLIRHAPLPEFKANPDFAKRPPNDSLYRPYPYDQHAWGMSVDLNRCIGCNACTIACQAENNIPVVGKEQVAIGREMHWIRVDSYFQGPASAPDIFFQPVPCMQCEDAPCELVCPVGATMHDSGGLNLQIYNRCVGTRFCSNNCPYKVRRFNFLEFTDPAPSLRAQRNPEVTVRREGVMEKCTYCLQRITTARIAAEERGTPIRDGEVVTACQAVCPTQAIVFGDLNDPGSRVSATKSSARNYVLLKEQNTRPRTTYLAKISNPNPAIQT
jgi:MoCo/4Fe-4S cofactor protein with predicted Tat translocation signal